MTNYKFIFCILIDGLRFDVFSDPKYRKLLPNISKIIDKGFLKKLISNGMITQVAMPSFFTQTFPLDYGGHNYGIKERPKSFIEIIKNNGFITNFVSSSYITGPFRNYEKGCDNVINLCDHSSIIEMYIRQFLNHEIEMKKKKKNSKKKFDELFKSSYLETLNYALDNKTRSNLKFMPRKFSKQTDLKIKRLLDEKKLLMSNPDLVLSKITSIPSTYYHYFVGDKKINKFKLFLIRVIEKLKSVLDIFLKNKIGLNFQFFPVYCCPTAKEVFENAETLVKENSFNFIHIYDAHHATKSGRFFNYLYKLKFLLKLIKINGSKKFFRGILYDLSLLYIDEQFKNFLDNQKSKNKIENSLFIFFGDHGTGIDPDRDSKLCKELGFRGYYEYLDVPFILSPVKKKPNNNKSHDIMSISATILDLLNLKQHQSFLGKSVFKDGDDFIISESTGKGNCDLRNKNIFFIISNEDFKLMVLFDGKKINPMRFYDKRVDKRELENQVEKSVYKNQIRIMIQFLKKKRFKLFIKD